MLAGAAALALAFAAALVLGPAPPAVASTECPDCQLGYRPITDDVGHYGLGVDADGTLYVFNSAGDIAKYSSSGRLLGTIPLGSSADGIPTWNGAVDRFDVGPDGSVYLTESANLDTNQARIFRVSPGGAVSLFYSTEGIFSDIAVGNDNVFVALSYWLWQVPDNSFDRIRRLTLGGIKAQEWGADGNAVFGLGVERRPAAGVYAGAADGHDDPYHVERFGELGGLITRWGNDGTFTGHITGIAIDSDEKPLGAAVWLANQGQQGCFYCLPRMSGFTQSGELVRRTGDGFPWVPDLVTSGGRLFGTLYAEGNGGVSLVEFIEEQPYAGDLKSGTISCKRSACRVPVRCDAPPDLLPSRVDTSGRLFL